MCVSSHDNTSLVFSEKSFSLYLKTFTEESLNSDLRTTYTSMSENLFIYKKRLRLRSVYHLNDVVW